MPNQTTKEEVIESIKSLSTPAGLKSQAYFGISDVNNFGLTAPQMRKIAKEIGKNHSLALQLWNTKIHEARHIAVMIADKEKVTEQLMERWMKDFNSWDIVDGCCGTLFDKTPVAYEKAMDWSGRKAEFQKRAGFSMMAMLAVHDKTATDQSFEQFFPFLLSESSDERNFVKKAINWALRQIGKRNERLCRKSIQLAQEIRSKGDAASRWIAADALRELEKYQREGKIKNIGTPGR